MKILKNERHKLEIVFPCSVPVANCIRRMLLSDVETWAVDRVIVQTNTSSMEDELLAHRLSLLPITAPLDLPASKLHFRAQVQCDVRTLHVENTHFALEGGAGASDVQFGHGEMVVCELHRGGELDVIATAIRGTGVQHAKWSAVTRATFEPVAEGMHFKIETAENVTAEGAFLQALAQLSRRLDRCCV